ncbi:MAG: RNA methyltransferase [Clostridia bacterium]|nr:RNA methyltransferase [Clostridia bacterium]
MSRIVEIHDLADPALDPYARLTERQLRPKHDPGSALFVAESRTVVTLALDAGIEPVSFLMDRSQMAGASADLVRDILADRFGDVPLYTADDGILEDLTGFALSRGVLSVMRRPALPSVEEVCRDARRIAVLEDIMDAANVGAIMRSAAALGMDAVLVTPRCSDPLLRRAARVSMGTVFQIPWTVIGERAEDWPACGMERLRRMGFRTAAMALSHDTADIRDPRLKRAERLAVLLGTEGTGLSAETVRCADYTVKIPMFHGVDSLNVAAAAAVAFWEFTQKR